MARTPRKVWKEWCLEFEECIIEREADGLLTIEARDDDVVACLSPTEARRLFQRLSGDYRD